MDFLIFTIRFWPRGILHWCFISVFFLMVDRSTAQVTIKKVEYHGWKDSIVLGNGKVEAVIVPGVGRIMDFRFVGEEEGPFWANRERDGKIVEGDNPRWVNIGGDKVWPAPM